jgi:membrane peptidoglycan carboxypeptidase
VPLDSFLASALERRYSASPRETFVTGGGIHRFHNFDALDDGRVLTVSEAFRRSVNLPFVRLMRDILRHELASSDETAMLGDSSDPRRMDYLVRFAESEGAQFLERFYRKYRGKRGDELLNALVVGPSLTPKRLALLMGGAVPALSAEGYTGKVRELLSASDASDRVLNELFATYGPERLDLQDRGYLAGVHPLEMWLVSHLLAHPDSSWPEVLDASTQARVHAYQWLFRTSRRSQQDRRIRLLLETEAFERIHEGWQRTGYPFSAITPSLAAAIGSSADCPTALAELLGILQNGGVRKQSLRVERLTLGQGSRYETRLVPEAHAPEQVIRPGVAAAVRDALFDVVENGTGRRAQGALADANGVEYRVGGKTGTGEDRFKEFARGGQLIGSHAVSRSAVFAFVIEDRFYGIVTAYVPGEMSESYRFTSSLAAQVFRQLSPVIRDVIARTDEARISSTVSVEEAEPESERRLAATRSSRCSPNHDGCEGALGL